MTNSKPISVPSWFREQVPANQDAVASTPPTTHQRIPRHTYDDHPLIVAVRQYNKTLQPRTLDEYVGILSAGIAAGDLLVPLRASHTSSRFYAVRAALRFAVKAVEEYRPVLAAHGVVDTLSFYGLDVERLLERTSGWKPKPSQPVRREITEAEWTLFGRAIQEHLRPPLRDVCLVVVQGDLRASDVLRITRPVAESVVQTGRAITTQKGGRKRTWDAEPIVRQALHRLLRLPGWTTLCDLVVRPEEIQEPHDAVRLSRTAYGRVYRALASLTTHVKELDFHGTHTFRRALATKLVRGRAPDRVIQKALGHANVATTQLYTGGASPDEVEEYRARARQEVFGPATKR
jgi:integrase